MAPCRSSLIRAVIHTWKDTSATFISRKKAIYSNVVQGYLDRILTFHGLLHGPLALFSYMEQHGSQEKIGGHVRLVTGKMYDASASPEGPHYDNESCLPFEPDDADPRDAQLTLPLLLGEGACGNVYAVRIRKDLLLKDGRTYSQPVKAVRKEFQGSSARENFLIENDILKSLPKPFHNNVMEPLLSYSVGPDTKYNILFEEASCSLKTYLFDKNNFPNGDIRKRLKNIERMIGLADGLVWLHKRLMRDSKSGSYKVHTYDHCDLRLANILLWYDSSSREYIFKISDFGNAQMSISQPESSHWFSWKDEKTSQKSDVWSFGCILFLVIIFNYEGVVGLIEFLSSLDRGGTSFYDSKAEKPNIQTTSCIQSLKNRIKTEPDKIVTGKILRLLENKIFKPLKRRAEIEVIHTEMASAYDERGLVTPIVMGREKPKSVSNFNHCAQSPNGEFEVFHGPETGYTLIVWRHELAAPLRLLSPLSPPESNIGSRIYPHSASCSTSSVCQVVTNKERVEISIYQIPETSEGTVSRQFITLTDIRMASNVAISPDGKFLAMDTKNSISSESKVRLFDIEHLSKQMHRVWDLPSFGEIPDEIVDDGVSSLSADLLGGQPARPGAEQTEALCFSRDNGYLYHVFKTESGDCPNSYECGIKIDTWDIKEKRCSESRPVKKSDLISPDFFQCLAPFNTRNGFIVITYNKRATAYLPNNKPVEVELDEQRQDTLKTVIIAADDTYAVLLGGEDRLNIYIADLGQLTTKGIQGIRLMVDLPGKYKYNAYKDAACIMEADGNVKILISYHDGRSVTFDIEVARYQKPGMRSNVKINSEGGA